MDVKYERCCGIDVHKKTVVACAIVSGTQLGEPEKETRTYATIADDLGALGQWLKAKGVTHIAMESTGVYWKPVFNLLEGQFTIVVVNAERSKALRGRKADAADAEWIADLLRHGLLPGSFIPSAQQCALRDLTRFRTSLVNDRVRAVNRLQKTLEDSNIKLASVVADVTGVSARAMLDALLAGQTDPQALADLARGQLRKKTGQLQRALAGTLQPHQRVVATELLSQIDYLEEAIERLTAEIAEMMRPFTAQLEHLDSIPGVSRRIAEVLIAEIGVVPHRTDCEGYKRWSFVRACSVVNRRCTVALAALRCRSQAAISRCTVAFSGKRRSKHCPVSTDSSISTILSQLPCLGV